ncbi:hypothetical protein EG328_004108 [Venturia inaequalis]|uniref:Uncharacterized protein n=1 Tax=Venturia inaequalis TaxID=5025 RepID=A0A8H3VFU4_VENIN|nr:hypothetical protein EG328_004108 [Venturia inaequalis]
MSNPRKRARSLDDGARSYPPRPQSHILTTEEISLIELITSLRAQHEDLIMLNYRLQNDVLEVMIRLENHLNGTGSTKRSKIKHTAAKVYARGPLISIARDIASQVLNGVLKEATNEPNGIASFSVRRILSTVNLEQVLRISRHFGPKRD